MAKLYRMSAELARSKKLFCVDCDEKIADHPEEEGCYVYILSSGDALCTFCKEDRDERYMDSMGDRSFDY